MCFFPAPEPVPVLFSRTIVVRNSRTSRRKGQVMAISASEARQRLFPLIEQVNNDHEPVRIASKAGEAVLMSAADYDSWQETVYLLRSPENARRLMEAVARDRAGHAAVPSVTKSLDDLREMASGQD